MEGSKKKEKRLPHIVLEPVESVRLRGVGFVITTPIYKPIESGNFVNKINKVVETYSTRLVSRTNTYFLIELTLPYYNSSVSIMLKHLNLNVKSVIDDLRILVSTETKNLTQYVDGKIHKSTLNVIKDIKQLDSSLKIGQSLTRAIREDVDKKKSINILIRLLDYLDQEERDTCLKYLYSILNSEEALTFNSNSLTVACGCSTSSIKKVAELPFVRLITESPISDRRIQKTAFGDVTKLYDLKELTLKQSDESLIPICVIDSGVSPVLKPFLLHNDPFNFFDLNETIPHGTSVSSVAIFGEDLLEGKKILEAKTKIISIKIDDSSIPDNKIMIEEAIMYAVRKYKNLTPIFNLSYVYTDIPDEQRLEMLNRLDRFIQKENVIVVNSAGNISQDRAYYQRDDYPSYISKNPIFCPSEGRNILAVGSISNQSNVGRIFYSRHTRIGIPPVLQNEEIDRVEFFKPEIHTYGGDAIPDNVQLKNVITNKTGFPVMVSDGSILYDCGTSFSAPLVSLCLSRLYTKYQSYLSNAETYKAILINKAIMGDCSGITTFSLIDTKNVDKCNDGVYLNFEGESGPHEKAENQVRKKLIKCKKINFFMPDEAESLDVVVVHSNNYPHQVTKDFNTKVILKFKKPQGSICKKEYGNIGRKSSVTFARYSFKRDYVGQWDVDLHIETSGIPAEIFDKMKIRFGVSLRINLKKQYIADLEKVHAKVFEKTKSKIRNPMSKEEQSISLDVSDTKTEVVIED